MCGATAGPSQPQACSGCHGCTGAATTDLLPDAVQVPGDELAQGTAGGCGSVVLWCRSLHRTRPPGVIVAKTACLWERCKPFGCVQMLWQEQVPATAAVCCVPHRGGHCRRVRGRGGASATCGGAVTLLPAKARPRIEGAVVIAIKSVHPRHGQAGTTSARHQTASNCHCSTSSLAASQGGSTNAHSTSQTHLGDGRSLW